MGRSAPAGGRLLRRAALALTLLTVGCGADGLVVRAGEGVKALRLHAEEGEVSVVGGAAVDVPTLRWEARGLSSSAQVISTERDGVWELELGCAGGLGCELVAVVELPPGLDVDVSVHAGALTIRGRFGVVDASFGQGEVMGRLAARRISMALGSGDVNLGLSEPPEALTVTLGLGDLDLSLPAQGYDLRLDLPKERAVVEGLTEDPAGPRLRALTANGSVRIRGTPRDTSTAAR
ncbi:hypothetical protein L6R49_22315 [Myxococcota bacterium]|nr:hypothetical protein [Myxococcota bacterium]